MYLVGVLVVWGAWGLPGGGRGVQHRHFWALYVSPSLDFVPGDPRAGGADERGG
jgi:hypothetical protein